MGTQPPPTPPLTPGPPRWSRVLNLLVRNRRWVGGLAFSLWSVAQTDPWMMAHPRLNTYGGVIAAYIFAAGKHKSDPEQREEQGRLGLLPAARGRIHLP